MRKDNEERQEIVRTLPLVDQQANSSQRSLRLGIRVNYRLLNDLYIRESQSTLAGSDGNGMDEDWVIVQLYITKIILITRRRGNIWS